jgi:hypothetical protein
MARKPTGRPRGRPRGSYRYREAHLGIEMAQLMLSGQAKTIGAAAGQVESKAGGGISRASRIKRLVRAYKQRSPWFLQQAKLRQNPPDSRQLFRETKEREAAYGSISEALIAQDRQAAQALKPFLDQLRAFDDVVKNASYKCR